jgi:prepilin-type N-terminal cleavage/methylation domain-containing protein
MKKNISRKQQPGFTLVEMAMVMLIIGLLLGGLIPTLSVQMEAQRINETSKQLEEIQQALVGFAIANGRLPCPASSSSNGEESPVGGGNCTNFYDGFVPAATLGITSVDSLGLVKDAWSNPIRYAVTSWSKTTTPTVNNVFTSDTGMRSATMENIATANQLNVCASATGITGSDCGTPANKLTDKVPALVFSTGKNGGYGGTGLDEAANLNGNRVFVSHTPTPDRTDTTENEEFDDLMLWVSPNILFNRMVAAGKLP